MEWFFVITVSEREREREKLYKIKKKLLRGGKQLKAVIYGATM
jgi:hypothetical protein